MKPNPWYKRRGNVLLVLAFGPPITVGGVGLVLALLDLGRWLVREIPKHITVIVGH